MLDKYNRKIFYSLRTIAYIFLVYLVLRYVPAVAFEENDLIRMVLLLSIIFVVIDQYYPNITRENYE